MLISPSFWLYSGGVGQGKTIATVRDAILHPLERVYAHRSMGLRRVPSLRTGEDKELIYWDTPDEWPFMDCGIVLVDECDMFFNSREFQKLSTAARHVMKEHRKQHLTFVANTQHISFVDKVMRTFIHQVRVVERQSMPLYGIIRPDAVRDTKACPKCSDIRDDLVGDNGTWLGRNLFFATRYKWTGLPPSVLMGDEDTLATNVLERCDLEPEDPRYLAPTGRGAFPFTQLVAECYDTSKKMSDHFYQNRNEVHAHV